MICQVKMSHLRIDLLNYWSNFVSNTVWQIFETFLPRLNDYVRWFRILILSCRKTEDALLEQVRAKFKLKLCISLIMRGSSSRGDVLNGANRLLKGADAIKVAVSLGGAMLAFDNSYQVSSAYVQDKHPSFSQQTFTLSQDVQLTTCLRAWCAMHVNRILT